MCLISNVNLSQYRKEEKNSSKKNPQKQHDPANNSNVDLSSKIFLSFITGRSSCLVSDPEFSVFYLIAYLAREEVDFGGGGRKGVSFTLTRGCW